ncbi:MAG: phosphatase PAP2 family protein [Pseudomonadota bacterium]
MVALLLLGVVGCQSPGGSGLGLTWPSSWQQLGQAARDSARAPDVWVPVAGAAAIAIADLDGEISRWAAKEQPLFGADAASDSDRLLDVAAGAWLASGVVARAPDTRTRLATLAAQAGTIVVAGGISEGMKSITGRTRPNGANDRSLPSGHATQAAVRFQLARRNLASSGLAPGARPWLRAGTYLGTAAAAWARVEADKHYPSDVLLGIGVGHFVGGWFSRAFMLPVTVAVYPSGWQVGYARRF